VNGVAVVEARLFGGEQVRVGNGVLLVERHAPAPAPGGDDAPTQTRFGGVIGASPEMRRLYPLCMRLAASTIPVVIEGETGTGKEALAEAIHSEGPRANEPFVVFDCTAVPASMMEAELFGHERGAFTGAVQRHAGVLEQAHGGTLLIDEIGDLDLSLQPKLLRAIERGEFRRIGGQQSIRVDVRILAATRRNLDREVELGRFRDDLFHRLAVGRIELPPLRRRRGEIAVLARVFAGDLGGDAAALPPHVLSQWAEHTWPGNVRELRNAVARYLALGEQHASSATPSTRSLDAPAGAGTADGVSAVAERVIAEGMPLARARQCVIDAFEERYLEAILARHGGVVTHAAKAAGIARRHFQRLRARPR
jgi:DNA-binding NtrC family response regulator